MEHDLELLALDIQEKINAEAQAKYGKAGFERWLKSERLGRMEDASCCGKLKGSCGDTIEVYLKIEGERIVEASGWSDGCGSSQICAGLAAELALGSTLDQAAAVEADTILERLPGFPADESHCAKLATGALHEAIHAYLTKDG
ncbi:iron-sulfur cluster assembly scaffold protein [Desulfocurvibacter africanus]|uniref:iron-sulfur cluster assembly scaffold protein n=1 Tax=Desulfocurvibacter africanus TaxID=873 RepID=UPI0004076B85|nr:iron-sulfur cluster scaffold-like protein [Desulfocurvibacter africanus]